VQLSDTPAKVPLPFGVSAAGPYITTIPIASQIGIEDGAASYIDGFPPLTFVPISAGGAGPWGQDFNGIFNQISAGVRWQQSGGFISYDATHSANIGGYPKLALISSALVEGKFWLSTVDNNTSNPDTGGANWIAFVLPGFPLTPISDLLGGTGSGFNAVTVGTGLKLSASILTAPSVGTEFWYSTIGAFVVTIPAWCNRIWGEVWGGGGGSSGGLGGGGGGGGYAAGFKAVVPGSSLTITVGSWGAGAIYPLSGGTGGTSSIGALMSATGGDGGLGGAGQGGVGSGGTINLTGGGASDLDGVLPAAPGGASPRGGFGGTVNTGGVNYPPTYPGGGGGGNAAIAGGQNGMQGAVYIVFLP
jgi:hypothetical protein